MANKNKKKKARKTAKKPSEGTAAVITPESTPAMGAKAAKEESEAITAAKAEETTDTIEPVKREQDTVEETPDQHFAPLESALEALSHAVPLLAHNEPSVPEGSAPVATPLPIEQLACHEPDSPKASAPEALPLFAVPLAHHNPISRRDLDLSKWDVISVRPQPACPPFSKLFFFTRSAVIELTGPTPQFKLRFKLPENPLAFPWCSIAVPGGVGQTVAETLRADLPHSDYRLQIECEGSEVKINEDEESRPEDWNKKRDTIPYRRDGVRSPSPSPHVQRVFVRVSTENIIGRRFLRAEGGVGKWEFDVATDLVPQVREEIRKFFWYYRGFQKTVFFQYGCCASFNPIFHEEFLNDLRQHTNLETSLYATTTYAKGGVLFECAKPKGKERPVWDRSLSIAAEKHQAATPREGRASSDIADWISSSNAGNPHGFHTRHGSSSSGLNPDAEPFVVPAKLLQAESPSLSAMVGFRSAFAPAHQEDGGTTVAVKTPSPNLTVKIPSPPLIVDLAVHRTVETGNIIKNSSLERRVGYRGIGLRKPGWQFPDPDEYEDSNENQTNWNKSVSRSTSGVLWVPGVPQLTAGRKSPQGAGEAALEDSKRYDEKTVPFSGEYSEAARRGRGRGYGRRGRGDERVDNSGAFDGGRRSAVSRRPDSSTDWRSHGGREGSQDARFLSYEDALRYDLGYAGGARGVRGRYGASAWEAGANATERDAVTSEHRTSTFGYLPSLPKNPIQDSQATLMPASETHLSKLLETRSTVQKPEVKHATKVEQFIVTRFSAVRWKYDDLVRELEAMGKVVKLEFFTKSQDFQHNTIIVSYYDPSPELRARKEIKLPSLEYPIGITLRGKAGKWS